MQYVTNQFAEPNDNHSVTFGADQPLSTHHLRQTPTARYSARVPGVPYAGTTQVSAVNRLLMFRTLIDLDPPEVSSDSIVHIV